MLATMTTRNQTPSVERTPSPFGDDDPRATFGRAVALGRAVVGAVRPDQLTGATPCPEFDVRTLLGHLVTVLRRVAVMGEGGHPLTVPFVTDVPGDDFAAAWRDAANDVASAWTDDATLARTITLPWTSMTGAEALEIYANEVTVHTWDLAVATGQRPAWDDAVVRVAAAAFARELPEDAAELRAIAPFAPPVPVAAEAPAIDRLVAANGRRPDWAA